MIRSTTRRTGPRQAAAAAELAILLPFILFLFVVTVDYARIFYYQMTLENCARNGAFFGANLRSYQETGWVSDNNIIDATLVDGATLNPPLEAGQVQVAHGTGSDGNPNVTVTINYTFTTVTSFPSFGTSQNIRTSASMRVAP